jgi:hypothetical protein
MTRNLIEARAWENGRERVCKKCEHYGTGSLEVRRYSWENCQKQVDCGSADDFSIWDGDSCCYFEPKRRMQ